MSVTSLKHRALLPGAWLGVLGGGQLGRMFCMAAHALGYRIAVLDPDESSPTAACADLHIRCAYDDEAGLRRLAERCQAVTTEFENVPARSLEFLARLVQVSPTGACVANAQDRMREKAFVRSCGIDVAPYAELRSPADLNGLPDQLFPGILKAARLGYDGKGQVTVADRAQAQAAFESLGSVECVLEKRLDLAAEISVIVARGFDGRHCVYPVAENVHVDGILARSTVPARISPALAERAAAATRSIAEQMNYVGVLCVEWFLLRDGSLVVNEMAPRPHNSGHYTIDACITSQFEQQARAMAGMPLGSPALKSPAVMLNLLGDIWFDSPAATEPRDPDWSAVLAEPCAKLHLYGKREARRGRKMGHLTVIAATLGEATAIASRLESRLGIGRR